jgi:alkylation response protein AidB-like acyl-CoA dehydrogenase
MRRFRDVARRFVDGHCPPRSAKEWDETNAYPAELFKAMAEMGWFGLPFPAEAGGEDGGPTELTIIAEQLGRANLDIAMCYIGTLIH